MSPEESRRRRFRATLIRLVGTATQGRRSIYPEAMPITPAELAEAIDRALEPYRLEEGRVIHASSPEVAETMRRFIAEEEAKEGEEELELLLIQAFEAQSGEESVSFFDPYLASGGPATMDGCFDLRKVARFLLERMR
jgi:hypothetical protein